MLRPFLAKRLSVGSHTSDCRTKHSSTQNLLNVLILARSLYPSCTSRNSFFSFDTVSFPYERISERGKSQTCWSVALTTLSFWQHKRKHYDANKTSTPLTLLFFRFVFFILTFRQVFPRRPLYSDKGVGKRT